MKKNVRLAALTALLVAAIGLSACAGVIPAAAQVVNNTLPIAARQAEQAAPAMLPPAQGVVAGDLQAKLQELYDEVGPSVVNIRVQTDMMAGLQGMFPGMPSSPDSPDMPDMDQLPEDLLPFLQPFLDRLNPDRGQEDDQGQDQNDDQGQEAPMMPRLNQALGSGFVWDEDGHIVTNNHVVANAKEIEVTFADGVTVPAELVGADPDSDLAVIKVDPKGLDLVAVKVADSTQVKPGQFVVAIGNPFGLEGSMTFGIVSALGRSLPANGGIEGMLGGGRTYTIPDIIQTDAPVNPGNSGGVLLDLEGQLVGVPTAIESSSGVSAGIGFAVPSTIVAKVAPELIADGAFEHPYIGISGGTLNPDLAEAMGLDASQRGALVGTIAEDGPAAEAGLRPSEETAEIDGQEVQVGGDVIIGIEGQPVKRFDDLVTYLARRGVVGQTVTLDILRDGKEQQVELTLAERPSPEQRAREAQAEQEQQQEQAQPEQREEPQAPAQPAPALGGAWLGIGGVTLTRDLNELLELSPRERGVLVVEVMADSPADEAGLRAGEEAAEFDGRQIPVGGDVIVALDGENVDSIEQLAQAIRAMDAGDEVELIVLRDGEEQTLTVTLAERPANP
jgi:S1-C subfamily serine protease